MNSLLPVPLKAEKNLRKWFGVLALLPICLLAHAEQRTKEEAIQYIDSLVEQKIKADAKEVPELIAYLTNKENHIHVRERAAWAIGQLDLRKHVLVLVEAAKDKGLFVRAAALNSLLHMRARTGLEVMKQIALSDPILNLRQRATVALGLLRWEKTIPILVELARDPREEVRGAAALSMAATQSKANDFTQALMEMAQDTSPYVQARAKKGLAVAKRENLSVQEHLQSGDPDIRLFAALYFHYHATKKDLIVLNEALNVEADNEVRFELERAILGTKRRLKREKERRERLRREKEAAKKKPVAN